MKVKNAKVYELEEGIRTSKYLMTTSTSKCSVDITNIFKDLRRSGEW
ncbi:MAG: hypothetical protein RR636_14470 [Clostridium sp.]